MAELILSENKTNLVKYFVLRNYELTVWHVLSGGWARGRPQRGQKIELDKLERKPYETHIREDSPYSRGTSILLDILSGGRCPPDAPKEVEKLI